MRSLGGSNSTKARPDTPRMGASTRINMHIQLGRLMLRTIFSVVDEKDRLMQVEALVVYWCSIGGVVSRGEV